MSLTLQQSSSCLTLFTPGGNFIALSDDALVDQLYCAEKYELEDLKAATLLHMVSTVSDLNVIRFLAAVAHCHVDGEFVDKFIQHCKK